MAKAPVDSVKVRMYRHGFGDCFLLSFHHGKDRVFSMVIDCGIKHNTKSKTVPIEKVMADLKKTLAQKNGKPRIDALVVTHEHWDHVAFFHPDDGHFDEFDIGQVWLAWTENPEDKEAIQINSRLREGAAALHLAAARLQAVAPEEAQRLSGLRIGAKVTGARAEFNAAMGEVLSFYGAGLGLAKTGGKAKSGPNVSKSGIKYKPDGKISVDTEDAMKHVVKLGEAGGVLYLNPGTTVEEAQLPPGVNIHVLGPPRNSLINKMNPTSGAGKETYLGIDHTGLAGFIEGVMQFGDAGRPQTKPPQTPFAANLGLKPDNLGANKQFFNEFYLKPGEEHRRIDNAWLDAAGQFALQLDGAINNTSLVLAIELQDSGHVLLFPGDAQVGSWLSWHDHTWKLKRDGKPAAVSAADLLKNTVLYKVSHHGSHNATVKDKGLEMMTHPNLVAMIPEKEKSYNGILYEPLVIRLNELCKGRVIVSADANYDPEELTTTRPAGLSAKEWAAFKADLDVQPEYIEYTVR